jgi:hypothetical protein
VHPINETKKAVTGQHSYENFDSEPEVAVTICRRRRGKKLQHLHFKTKSEKLQCHYFFSKKVNIGA